MFQIRQERAVSHCLIELGIREIVPQGDVIPDRGIEEIHILLDIADLPLRLLHAQSLAFLPPNRIVPL